MNIAPPSDAARRLPAAQLRDTQEAFDSVAADYDGPRGNNELIQEMRGEMWRQLDATFAPGSQLLDLGCGTGLDAVRLARQGHHVTATDWSQRMVERTADRAARESLTEHVRVVPVGAHELQCIGGREMFDGAYSNLGVLNCVPDLGAVADHCARLLKARGSLVFTVIGRICPWEIAHYALRWNWPRVRVRFATGMVPVRLNQRVVWTRYYSPHELYKSFERHFRLEHYRGLCVFAPPPYLTGVKRKHSRLYESLWRLDRRITSWPVLRGMGDHFLIVMSRRP